MTGEWTFSGGSLLEDGKLVLGGGELVPVLPALCASHNTALQRAVEEGRGMPGKWISPSNSRAVKDTSNELIALALTHEWALKLAEAHNAALQRAVEEEREACAEIADRNRGVPCDTAAEEIAAKIRARGQA